MTDTIGSVRCMSCGGLAYLDIVTGKWRHQYQEDFLSGGAHFVVVPDPQPKVNK